MLEEEEEQQQQQRSASTGKVVPGPLAGRAGKFVWVKGRSYALLLRRWDCNCIDNRRRRLRIVLHVADF